MPMMIWRTFSTIVRVSSGDGIVNDGLKSSRYLHKIMQISTAWSWPFDVLIIEFSPAYLLESFAGFWGDDRSMKLLTGRL